MEEKLQQLTEFNWSQIQDLKDRWYTFINRAFVLYRGESRRTVADLAREIGVSQGLLTQWMQKNGKVPRSLISINKLVAFFGSVIYDVLGLDRSDNFEEASDFPPKLKEAFLEIKRLIFNAGVLGDSPEAVEIVKSTLAKYGYNVTDPDEVASEK